MNLKKSIIEKNSLYGNSSQNNNRYLFFPQVFFLDEENRYVYNLGIYDNIPEAKVNIFKYLIETESILFDENNLPGTLRSILQEDFYNNHIDYYENNNNNIENLYDNLYENFPYEKIKEDVDLNYIISLFYCECNFTFQINKICY